MPWRQIIGLLVGATVGFGITRLVRRGGDEGG